MAEYHVLTGRKQIFSSAEEITKENVLEELKKANKIHEENSKEISYLYDYYKGKQPILNRQKAVRPEICNKIVENRANEIVSFKTSYLIGEPIEYVSRSEDEDIEDKIIQLNRMMFAEDKSGKDQEIVEWQMICGTAFRMILPKNKEEDEEDVPFSMYTLDPRDTFVVYSTDIGNKPLMGVKILRDAEDEKKATYSIYTPSTYFLVADGEIQTETPHALGMIPIFEYPANSSRLGSFEIVLPLLDTLNNIQSNRMDGVEQHIQSFMKFVNCDISSDDFDELKEKGAILIRSINQSAPADVDIISTTLDQDQTQTLKEDIYSAILEICGMPSRTGGGVSSTSDTGRAVMLREGWALAESRAKDSEHAFKRAEKKMLRLVLHILRTMPNGIDLSLKDIDMKFTRRNYENLQSKSQVLISMLQEPKIHPLLAFEYSGMFTDPESAYAMSMDNYEKMLENYEPTEVNENEDLSSNR